MLGGFVDVVGPVSRAFPHLMNTGKGDSPRDVNRVVNGDAALRLHIRRILVLLGDSD